MKLGQVVFIAITSETEKSLRVRLTFLPPAKTGGGKLNLGLETSLHTSNAYTTVLLLPYSLLLLPHPLLFLPYPLLLLPYPLLLLPGGSILLYPAGEEWPFSLLLCYCSGDHHQGF